jgi:hypothetical protein
MHLAAASGHKAVVKIIIEEGTVKKSTKDAKDQVRGGDAGRE